MSSQNLTNKRNSTKTTEIESKNLDEENNEKYKNYSDDSEEFEEIMSIPYKKITNSDKQFDTICDFILKEEIGEGTFGHVKLAINRQTGEKVAIKIMEKSKIFQNEDKERIEREIKILKTVRHPNIVHLYTVLQTKENLYLIMEYAKGTELFEYIIKNKKIDELTACCFYQQLISGIEYLHKNNIVHRDIKLENLIINPKTKELKIVDFGLSNIFSNKNYQLLSSSCGSPSYAPPEMLSGGDYKATPVDIWSSGIVLYAMVCGYLPFKDDNNKILYEKIKNGKFNIPKFISENLKNLLKKILVTDPEKRISIKQIKKHPWFNLYNNNGKIIEYEGLFINKYIIPIDEKIVKKMTKKIGISEESIIISITMNKHNDISTLYYLFLYKKINSSSYYKSVSDLKSDLFKEYIKDKINLLSNYNYDFQIIINERKQNILSDKTLVSLYNINENNSNRNIRRCADFRPLSVEEFKSINSLSKYNNINTNSTQKKLKNEKKNIKNFNDSVKNTKRNNEDNEDKSDNDNIKKMIKLNSYKIEKTNMSDYRHSDPYILNLKTERNKNAKLALTSSKNKNNKFDNETLEKILSSLKKEIQDKGLQKVSESQQEINIISNKVVNNIPLKNQYTKKDSYIHHLLMNKKKIFTKLEKNDNSSEVNSRSIDNIMNHNNDYSNGSLSAERRRFKTKQAKKNNVSGDKISAAIKVKASNNHVNISKKNIYENQLVKIYNKNDIENKKNNFSNNTNKENCYNKLIPKNRNSKNNNSFFNSFNNNYNNSSTTRPNKFITKTQNRIPKNKNNCNSNLLSTVSIQNYTKKSNYNTNSSNKRMLNNSSSKNCHKKLKTDNNMSYKRSYNGKIRKKNLKTNINPSKVNQKSPQKSLFTSYNNSKNKKLKSSNISEIINKQLKRKIRNKEEEKNNINKKAAMSIQSYNNNLKLLNSYRQNGSDVNILRNYQLSFSEENENNSLLETPCKFLGEENIFEQKLYQPLNLCDIYMKNKYILKTDIINNLQELKLKYKNKGFIFFVYNQKENVSFHIIIENINNSGCHIIKYKKNNGNYDNFIKTIKKITIYI